MHECNGSSPLVTPLVATVESWAWGKQTEATERTVVVVSYQRCRLSDENEGALWRGSREMTKCLGDVTNQNQDSLQQRKESGLLRSET